MGVFQYIAELKWEKTKSENIEYYANVFSKICIALQDNVDYDDVLTDIKWSKMTLENRLKVLRKC